MSLLIEELVITVKLIKWGEPPMGVGGSGGWGKNPFNGVQNAKKW